MTVQRYADRAEQPAGVDDVVGRVDQANRASGAGGHEIPDSRQALGRERSGLDNLANGHGTPSARGPVTVERRRTPAAKTPRPSAGEPVEHVHVLRGEGHVTCAKV